MVGTDFLSFLVLAAISVVVVAAKAIATRGGSGRDPLEIGSRGRLGRRMAGFAGIRALV